MQLSHKELQALYDSILSTEIKARINVFLNQNLEDFENKYETAMIWEAVSLIDGNGGYCMPANLVN